MRTWRRLVTAIVVLATAFLFYRWWQAASSKAGSRAHAAADSVDTDPLPEAKAQHGAWIAPGDPEHGEDGAGPKLDRAKADRMREEIRALLAEAGPLLLGSAPSAAPSASAAQAFPTMPLLPPDDAGNAKVDPKYIQSRVREDLFPLALDCYSDALKRNPKLSGKLAVYFKVIGDKKVGGVVDEVKMMGDTTIDDAAMQTCVKESMMSVSFDAPPDDGELTVVYPIVFSPDEPEGGAGN